MDRSMVTAKLEMLCDSIGIDKAVHKTHFSIRLSSSYAFYTMADIGMFDGNSTSSKMTTTPMYVCLVLKYDEVCEDNVCLMSMLSMWFLLCKCTVDRSLCGRSS